MKRFYKDVAVDETAAGWRVLLDGRVVKTAGGKPQAVPSRALAEALADEWRGQGEEIDTSALVLRDLADFAIDAVAPERAAIIAELGAYAETDTLCYRADPDEALYQRQLARWEPLLAAVESRWGLQFTRVSGVMHKPQPATTLARIKAILERRDAFTLASMRMTASLAASLSIALAALDPEADPTELWALANLEEDWQAELWGEDADAAQVRQRRCEAFALAIRFARLATADRADA